MHRAFHLVFIGFLSTVLLIYAGFACAQSMIRTVGDNTGISFAEETRGARPINGNIRGITFCQWITGLREPACGSGESASWRIRTLPPSSKNKIPMAADTTRILTSEDLKELTKGGILVAD